MLSIAMIVNLKEDDLIESHKVTTFYRDKW